MARLVIRNLDDAIKTKLQKRARRHGRSTEAEVREILNDAVREEDQARPPLGSSIAARFTGIGLDQDIPELRSELVR